MAPISLIKYKIADASTDASIEIDDPGGKALRDAGLLTELAPGLRELAKPSVSLQEVIAILDRAGGKPLSEMVLEQRRWKDPDSDHESKDDANL